MLTWVFSVSSTNGHLDQNGPTDMPQQLWHNIVYYWIGALTNSPQKLTHYVGIFRGVLGAGEAICFGLDSIKIPFTAEAGGILLFYVIGIGAFYYLGIYHIKDTNYDHAEEGAIVPNHVLEGEGLTVGQRREEILRARQVAVPGDDKLEQRVRVDSDKV